MSSEKSDLVHCNKCQHCHFQVTLDYCKDWQAEWAHRCKTMDESWLENYGIKDRKPPTIADSYGQCFSCGSTHKDFSDGAGPKYRDGSTIQPILGREFDLET